jgi:hypothetical protein
VEDLKLLQSSGEYKQELTWGSFEKWVDFEQYTQGFWDINSTQPSEASGTNATNLQSNETSDTTSQSSKFDRITIQLSGDRQGLIWGSFERWADLEKFTHGFWDIILLPSDGSNILGLKFVGFDYRFIRPKFVYPSQPLEPDILYRVYGPVDKFLSPIRHALIFFENLIITPRMQTSEEQSSQQQIQQQTSQQTQEQSLQQKTQWVYFSLWDEMAKIKNGWWGD